MTGTQVDQTRFRALGNDPVYTNQGGVAYFTEFPSKPEEILAADPRWKDNRHLIWAVAQFGWLDGEVLDLTLGSGVFWKAWRPEGLVTNDLRPETGADHSHDFRALPEEWEGRFDAVVLDPPYAAKGTVTTSRLEDDCRYGLLKDLKLPARMNAVVAGVAEAARVCSSGGWVHVKCQNQTAHHRFRDQVAMVVEAAGVFGLSRVAEWGFVNPSPRPQPGGRLHVTPRNNTSTLITLRKG